MAAREVCFRHERSNTRLGLLPSKNPRRSHHSNAGQRVVAPWRLHDLRRTFATNMQRLDVRFEVTEALLTTSAVLAPASPGSISDMTGAMRNERPSRSGQIAWMR
jgi:hypothetical protein